MIQKPKRLFYFDLLRLLLVLAALASHYMGSQNWDDLLSEKAMVAIKGISRNAMPGLLIVFGFMLEYIYSRKWQVKGGRTVFRRIVHRTVLSYFAFVALAFIGFLGGHNEPRVFWNSFVLMADATHANLFKYYAILFPIIFILMMVRFKYGWKAKILSILSLIGICEIINSGLPGFSDPALGQFFALFTGFGDLWGPSIVHSLLLVLFGEIAAHFTLSRSKRSLTVLMGTLLVSFLLLIAEILQIGLGAFLYNIYDYGAYRANNNVMYFAYGFAMTAVMGLGAMGIGKVTGKRLKALVTYYGGDTFVLFFYGNVIILLTPALKLPLFYSVLVLAGTLLFSLASINLINYLIRHSVGFQFLKSGIEKFSDGLATWLYANKPASLSAKAGKLLIYANRRKF